MTPDHLYQIYHGPIPDRIKLVMPYDALNHYYYAYLKQMERNLTRHSREIILAIQSWRIVEKYPDDMREMMLERLTRALTQARFSAVEISESLKSVSPDNSV